MESTFEKQVRRALENLHFTQEQIHLETTRSGSVGGHIVSGSFSGQSQMERQDNLWQGLRQELGPDELTRIVALLTVTPEEISDDE